MKLIKNKLLDLRYKYFPNWKTVKYRLSYWKTDEEYGYTTYKIRYSNIRDEYKLVINGRYDKDSKRFKEMIHNLYRFKNKNKRVKLIEKPLI